ncbi:MAG: DUF4430 domain-containing protein [Eubacterium sp.]
MKYCKKITALLLTVVLSICITSCSANESRVETSGEPSSSAVTHAQVIKENDTTIKAEADKKESVGSTEGTKATVKKDSSTSAPSSKAEAKNETSKQIQSTEAATVTTKRNADKTTVKATEKSTGITTTQNPYACFVTIQCKSINENIDDLKPGHEKFVPSNGIILNSCPYIVNDGDTAYDALKAVCKSNNIKLTADNTGYGVYIIGINNLDEKDCGKYSGWKYKVNSSYPSVSCDKAFISAGDKIEFEYVCELS